MSDIAGGISDNLSSISDINQIARIGVDKNRVNFLKGLTSTTSGQKEDPTYTGFRIMFDFGNGALVDPETFLPVSPLFADAGNFQNGMSVDKNANMDVFTYSKQFLRDDEVFPNYTNNFMYMTAQRYLHERRSLSEDPSASPRDYTNNLEKDNSGKIAKGLPSGNKGHRYESIVAFKNFINNINQKSPWYFQSIDGLDNILKVNIPRQVGGNIGTYKSQRSGILTFNCMDSIDLRVNAMAELYRKATYDYQYHREALPANLRKFRMWIIVTEIREMVLKQQLGNVLNPFNISGVASSYSNLSSLAQSSGILSNPASDPSSSVNGNTSNSNANKLYDSLNKLEPYVLMYQLDLCEFNFDDSYAFNKLDNGANTIPVNNKFKVHVGSVKEYKMQYNILKDFISNGKDNGPFNSILIQDSWNLGGSVIGTSADIQNDSNIFTKLANNFINNSVASVIQQQFSPIVTKAILGNAYGFNLSQTLNSLNSAQDLISGIQNIKNPLSDYTPQSRGLGGPSERQYPVVNNDVYPPPYLSPNGGIGGNVYGTNNPAPTLGNIDLYPTDPGTDSGLPGRQYPVNNQQDYSGVPGQELGVPGRVYPTINNDLYPTDPGVDLGLPSRQYPISNLDEYQTTPGVDLGVPFRIYPVINQDQYLTDPGVDLGLPDRQYPIINEEDYSGVPGQKLGVPFRIYPVINQDQYSTDPGVDLGLPDRQYPVINEQDYAKNNRVYQAINDDVYPSNAPSLGLPERQYPTIKENDY